MRDSRNLRRLRQHMCGVALLFALALFVACNSAQGAAPAAPAPPTRTALNVTVVSPAEPVDTATPVSATDLSTLVARATPVSTAGESNTTALVAAQPAPPQPSAAPADAPLRVVIPRADVNAPIVPLGETDSGAMATPATPTDVGWWQYGVAPGSVGSAVLGGHLDFHDYGAAVFWNLNKLRPGDEVDVTSASGARLRFVVQSAEVYSENDTSVIDRIFRQHDTARLNLITCAGTFNPVTRDYDKRLVVYTVLAQ